MTRTQAVLLQCLVAALTTFVGAMADNTESKVGMGAVFTGIAGIVANKTSKHNPDGTPAQVPFVDSKETKHEIPPV